MLFTILSYWAAICGGALFGWILHSIFSPSSYEYYDKGWRDAEEAFSYSMHLDTPYQEKRIHAN